MTPSIYSTLLREFKRDLMNGIIRHKIFLRKTPNVPAESVAAVREGLDKIVNEICWNFAIGEARIEDNALELFQIQSLTSEMRGYGKQVSALMLHDLLLKNPYPLNQHNFQVLVIHHDMRKSAQHPENDHLFGFGWYPHVIISNRRIQDIQDQDLRRGALAVLAAHEFCHNLGLVERTYNTGREGKYKAHCAGEKGMCLMEQSRILDENGSFAVGDFYSKKFWLCDDCIKEVTVKKLVLNQLGASY